MAPVDRQRLESAYAAIDLANADDPNRLEIRGEWRPKELAHAALACEWILRLSEEPSEALLLAARAHHVRRWEIPRSDYPEGRPGYLRWRKALQEHHASVTASILADEGYDDASVARVGAILRKQGLGRDPEVQAFEDALCLVFLETQLHDLAARLEREKLPGVVQKTLRKMSPEAVSLARQLLTAEDLALLDSALGDS